MCTLFIGCVPFSRVDQRGLERTSLQAGAALEALILIDAVSLILAALNAGGRTVLGADAAVMDSKNVRKVKTVPETPCLQRPVYGRFVKNAVRERFRACALMLASRLPGQRYRLKL